MFPAKLQRTISKQTNKISSRDAVLAYMQPSKYDQRFTPWLLKHGANPDLPDRFGTSPLYYIAGYGSLSILQLLFDHGAKVDNNAIFAVIRKKDTHNPERIQMVELLLSKGADVNFLHEYERRLTSSALVYARRYRHTPLWEAVKTRDVQMVELLIRNGADVHQRIWVNKEEKSSSLEEMLACTCFKIRDIGRRFKKSESIAQAEGRGI
jgi:ankyrin repeat protein